MGTQRIRIFYLAHTLRLLICNMHAITGMTVFPTQSRPTRREDGAVWECSSTAEEGFLTRCVMLRSSSKHTDIMERHVRVLEKRVTNTP